MLFPTSLPFCRRHTPSVVTIVPLRSTLGYGPACVMMLSALVVTCILTGLVAGKISVQPVVSAVSWNVSSTVSLSMGMTLMFHLPATSASVIGAGGAAGAGAAAGAGVTTVFE